jgi:hypothetical protein
MQSGRHARRRKRVWMRTLGHRAGGGIRVSWVRQAICGDSRIQGRVRCRPADIAGSDGRVLAGGANTML